MLVNELHQGGIRALLAWDNTIFDSMQLPEGVELDDVVDHILYKYGDAPLFSPDPSVVKFYIGRWSKRRLPLWERYKAAIELEYNPLENYDRMELETFTHGKSISHTGTITDDTSGTIDRSTTGSITDTPSGTIKVERDDITTNDLSADNSSDYQPDNKSTLDGETKTTYQNYQEQRTFNGYTESENYRDYEQERTFNDTEAASGDDVKDSRIHGNIGVTTSQMMLASELDLIPRLDLIDYIAEDWHSEFNMMMYL